MSRNRSSGGGSRRVTRRAALTQLGLGLGAAAIGSGCVPPDRCEAGPDDPPAGPDFDESGAPTARRLLSGIDTFVVVMMENRSFDHLFGSLALDPDYAARDVVDGLTGTEWNPDEDGTPVHVQRTANVDNYGPKHDWDGAHKAHAGGRNDGFVRANVGDRKKDAMSFHDRGQLPLLYALADQYTVCDRWFSSVLGPTWPNRFYLHAATSGGITSNAPLVDGPATVWERLGKKCWSSRCYAAGLAHWYFAAFRGRTIAGNDPMSAAFIEDFFRDAREGNLPSFSVIDPDFWSSDLHPPHSLALGEALLGAIVRSMQESPQWKRSLLVITFDENGGFFDHVPPPTTTDPRPDFRRLGFRVPALVIGPTVRRGQVVSATFEHVSVAATLRARFGIESLGPRMDAAADLSPCIDPDLIGLSAGPLSHPGAPRDRPAVPPAKLPQLTLDRRRVEEVSFRFTSQPGIDQAVRDGHIPAHLIDPRAPEERLRSLLRHVQELEVARVKG